MLTFHKRLLALFLLRQSLVNCEQPDNWVEHKRMVENPGYLHCNKVKLTYLAMIEVFSLN